MISLPRPHWSYSAISQYLRCPLQFYFKRILKLPELRMGSGLLLGSAVHHALAFYHLTLQQHGEVNRDELHRAFREHLAQRESESHIDWKPGESREELEAQGIGLLDLYLNQPPPGDIVMVEQTLLVPLITSDDEILETPLMAIADLVTGNSSSLKITEFKTSGRSYGEFEVHRSLQATCYAHALHEQTGIWPTVEYAVLVKTKAPKLQRLKTTRNKDDGNRLGDLMKQIETGIENQVFYPVESPLNCSGCAYREPCQDWKPNSSFSPIVHLNGRSKC
ncbi:MAG TPA: PD-(D/E)XK nuclease family protein [Planctomicrobium sp.]|nr:PD-(D/E)XK nuclease family protein [Planctomicrobium sp.]